MEPMSTAAGTCLSDLPDDLLQRILYFVPAKEAASTAVLSRRWRSLLPTPWSGAGVHLDTRSYESADFGDDSLDIRRDAFFQGAKAALAEHESVRRLTVHVEVKDPYYEIRGSMFRDRYTLIVYDVLSHPACRDVEVLRIEAHDSVWRAGSKDHDEPHSDVGYYELSFGAVPSENLWDLHITNCRDLTSPPPDTVFPCLAVLRLQSCVVSLDSLQNMIMASPLLDILHLDYVYITTEVCLPTDYEVDGYMHCIEETYDRGGYCSALVQSLCVPTVTTLFLDNCCYDEEFAIVLDAPRVRHFRHSRLVHRFPMKSPPPDLTRVDLHIFDAVCCYDHRPMCTVFWPSVKNYRNTKVLNLKLMCPIEDIAVADKKIHDELLDEMLFNNLEHLELDIKHKTATREAAVAIGNLLQCCPAVTDLRLKLNTVNDNPYRTRNSWYLDPTQHKITFNRNAQLDFRKSIDHFMHRKDPVVSFGGDDDNYEVISDIPGLSDKWFNFNCLRFYLKRVSPQFRLEKSNCFPVQLAKFFFERAMVLEEMCIDDGNKKTCEHMNRKFAGCTTNPFQPCSEYKVFPGVSQEVGVKRFSSFRIRERLPKNSKHEVRRRNSWSSGFTILPLER